MSDTAIFAVAARFASVDDLETAVRRLKAAGHGRLETYTPYPVESLSKLVGSPPSPVPWFFLICGLAGAVIGFLGQLYGAAIDYPINIGGRPLNSWPMFVPIANEVMILSAVVGGIAGMLIATGLPHLYHPIFAVPQFDRASSDGFFLSVMARDPTDYEEIRRLLTGCRPLAIVDVPA